MTMMKRMPCWLESSEKGTEFSRYVTYHIGSPTRLGFVLLSTSTRLQFPLADEGAPCIACERLEQNARRTGYALGELHEFSPPLPRHTSGDGILVKFHIEPITIDTDSPAAHVLYGSTIFHFRHDSVGTLVLT